MDVATTVSTMQGRPMGLPAGYTIDMCLLRVSVRAVTDAAGVAGITTHASIRLIPREAASSRVDYSVRDNQDRRRSSKCDGLGYRGQDRQPGVQLQRFRPQVGCAEEV